MNTLEAIMTRRSYHQFKDTPVSDDQLKKILAAAMQAPSSGDGRPWHFIVIKDREKLDAFADKIDEGNHMFKEAQAAILLCSNVSREGFPGYYPQDCACAGQNIYLAAHELGLGTVWFTLWGVAPRINGCKEIVSFPQGIEPFALFPLGEPNEDLGVEDRYDDNMVIWE